jgi:ribonuclease BN (tRNA processing enzyme)
VEHGIKLAEESGCKRMIFAHFDPEYTDEQLDAYMELIPQNSPTQYIMAREGLEVEL